MSSELLNEKPKGNASVSYYRRLLVAYLIEQDINSVPKIMAATGFPRRTIQEIIVSLSDMDIIVEFVGARKNGHYVIHDWAGINRNWVSENMDMICNDRLGITLVL
ncbi:helix-turn-helix domain-containing protein [Shewanella sp. BF02_Schw]|uniref:helix-turn-helix domain-containing protein n=1 Tax=Shewanella sp. BF02_Schw TaxID=394908 RepID=UPI00178377D8|nr:helix-turn-helix domain-containing protein [Shewanella sp. BF02_Schw]MBO1897765.1 helix-turn-helix domain-containing protein [Shewanella sp. BF02_Schw]